MKRERRARILATLGPASSSLESIRALAEAGADVFRLNFSHGSHADHAERLQLIRRVEQEIRKLEEAEWSKTDPEKSARADDMVSKLREAIAKIEADLDKARAAGNDKKVSSLEADLESRRSFLEMAERTAAEFG